MRVITLTDEEAWLLDWFLEEHKNNLSNAGCNDLPLEIQAKFANRCMEVERDFAKLNNPENPEGPEWPIPDYCMVSWLQWRLSSKL